MKFSLKRILILVFSTLLLSGCLFTEEQRVDVLWVNPDPYFGVDHPFVQAGLPSYVTETDVFRIQDEKEVALLAAILYHQSIYKFNYVSENVLSLNKIFAYMESLLPASFKLSLSELSYTQQDEVVLTLYALEIQNVLSYPDDNLEAYTQTWVDTLINPQDTQTEKIKVLHDNLVMQIHYDTSILDLDLTQISSHPSFEAMGLFLNNTAVCSGYARAFNALAKEANIPSIMVSSQAMNHAWNLVYDGQTWVYVDVTFDDPIPDLANKVRYTYFMLNEDKFLKDGKHWFDESSDQTLSASDYLAFAEYVFNTIP